MAENEIPESCMRHAPFKTLTKEEVEENLDNQKRFCMPASSANKRKDFMLNGRQNLAVHRFNQYSDASNKGIMLMHSVGSGKTLTSLTMAINSFDWSLENRAAKTILIVAPSGIFQNFVDELNYNIPICCGNVTNDGNRKRAMLKINNELQPMYLESMKYSDFTRYFNVKLDMAKVSRVFENKVIIFDECHRLFRQVQTEPAENKSLLQLFIDNRYLENCIRFIAMTGTPYNLSSSDMILMAQFVELSASEKTYEDSVYKITDFKNDIAPNRENRCLIQSILFGSIFLILNTVPDFISTTPYNNIVDFFIELIDIIEEEYNKDNNFMQNIGRLKDAILKNRFHKFKPQLEKQKRKIEKALDEQFPPRQETFVQRVNGYVFGFINRVIDDPLGIGSALVPDKIEILGGSKMNRENAFKILELKEINDIHLIERAYKILALFWHPDKNKTAEAKSKFTEIATAYNFLLCEIDPINKGKDCQQFNDNDNKIPISIEDYFNTIEKSFDGLTSKEKKEYLKLNLEILISSEFKNFLRKNKDVVEPMLKNLCTPENILQIIPYVINIKSDYLSRNIREIKTNIALPENRLLFEIVNGFNLPNRKIITYIDQIKQITDKKSPNIIKGGIGESIINYFNRNTGLGSIVYWGLIKLFNFDMPIQLKKVSRKILDVYSPIDVNMLPVHESFSGNIKIDNQNVVFTPGFSSTNLDIITNNIKTTIPTGFVYPEQEVHFIYTQYSAHQIMFSSEVRSYFINKLKHKWWYSYCKDLDSSRNGMLRGIGNYSQDFEKFLPVYTSGETPEGFYPYYKNTIPKNVRVSQDELNAFNLKQGRFKCEKFLRVLLNLLIMKTGIMFSKDGIIEQPHLTLPTPKSSMVKVNGEIRERRYELGDDDYDLENWQSMVGRVNNGLWEKIPFNEATEYYLPLVYSCSEEIGLNLFASFINSYGFNCVILNKDESDDVLEREKKRTYKKTYPLITGELRRNIIRYVSDNYFSGKESNLEEAIVYIKTQFIDKLNPVERDKIYNTPICSLLNKDMTEGLDCKFNPAIFLLEPANSYGDYDQLCGRVLRTYSGKYRVRPKKMIYQCAAFNYENLSEIYNRRNWPKPGRIEERQRVFFDQGRIREEIFVALEQSKDKFSEFRPKTMLEYVFPKTSRTWSEFNSLWGLWFTNKFNIDNFSNKNLNAESKIKNKAINALLGFETNINLFGFFQYFTGTNDVKLAYYNQQVELNRLKVQTFLDKYSFLHTDEQKDIANMNEMENNYFDNENRRASEGEFSEYQKALKELMNFTLESTSPDLDSLQKLQIINNEITIIKKSFIDDKFPDLTVIKNYASTIRNSQYLPWGTNYPNYVSDSSRLSKNIIRDSVIGYLNNEQHNTAKMSLINTLTRIYNGEQRNIELSGQINAAINNFNQTINLTVNNNPLVINNLPIVVNCDVPAPVPVPVEPQQQQPGQGYNLRPRQGGYNSFKLKRKLRNTQKSKNKRFTKKKH